MRSLRARANGCNASLTTAPAFPATRALYERDDVASVRARLGSEAFGLAWAEGRAMRPEEAAAEAIAWST
jgi:hypothetical protein